jgi:hypothetical protein
MITAEIMAVLWTALALCQANAGSYYATNTAGEIAIYVHPTGSGNPNTNGNAYRWVD